MSFGWNANIQTKVECGVNLERNFLALEFLDGFFKQSYVGVVANGFDVPVLLATQQICPRRAVLNLMRQS